MEYENALIEAKSEYNWVSISLNLARKEIKKLEIDNKSLKQRIKDLQWEVNNLKDLHEPKYREDNMN